MTNKTKAAIEKTAKLPTARDVFKSTLEELGFAGYKPSQMTNSDYWLCTCTAIESHTAAHTAGLLERTKDLEAKIASYESAIDGLKKVVDSLYSQRST